MKIHIRNPHEILNFLIKNKIPYLLEQTMFTKTIYAKGNEYYFVSNDSGIKKHELGFIGLVKKHCEKLNVSINVDRSKINYIQPDINFKQSYKIKNKWEIDLTGAYWEFCNSQGWLTQSLYERGLEVKKKVRLIAMGNLAKRTAIIKFDGTKHEPIKFERSLGTENIFFYVSQLTDLLMRKLIVLAGEDFLFYWCDAIFVDSEEAKDKIVKYLNEELIKHKVIFINSIFRDKHRIETIDEAHINLKIDPKTGKEKNPLGKRVFNFRKNNLLIGQINKPKKMTLKQKAINWTYEINGYSVLTESDGVYKLIAKNDKDAIKKFRELFQGILFESIKTRYK